MVTDKKNQHYVPKFYLRNFSFEDNKKQIGLFNLENEFYIKRAKLKTQASKNFFYGQDGVIEDQLANIEGDLSFIIKNIVSTRKIPDKETFEYEQLLYFVALTDLRNPIRLKQMNDSYYEMYEHFATNDPSFDFESFLPPMSSESIIKLQINTTPEIVSVMKDLSCKLLINSTSTPFITSDYPIVKYNQFLENRKHPQSNTGYGTVGLQIFIPLNAELVLVFYDQHIYKIGERKSFSIKVNKNQDVDQINTLQLINCFSTVFFDHQADEKYIRNIYSVSKKFERANITNFSTGYLLTKDNENIILDDDTQDNLLIFSNKDCQIDLNISVMKIHSKGKKHQLSDSVAQTRNYVSKLLDR